MPKMRGFASLAANCRSNSSCANGDGGVYERFRKEAVDLRKELGMLAGLVRKLFAKYRQAAFGRYASRFVLGHLAVIRHCSGHPGIKTESRRSIFVTYFFAVSGPACVFGRSGANTTAQPSSGL
jgi:hypothetical protein